MKIVNTGNNMWEVWHDDNVFILGPFDHPGKAEIEMLAYVWDSVSTCEDDDIPF